MPSSHRLTPHESRIAKATATAVIAAMTMPASEASTDADAAGSPAPVMSDEGSDFAHQVAAAAPPPNCPNGGVCAEILKHAKDQAVEPKRSDSYSRDQKVLLRWLGGVLACAILGWGTWITVQVFGLGTQVAVAATEAKAIQAQLSRIEVAVIEIQRELRSKP